MNTILLLSLLWTNFSCDFMREHPNLKNMMPDAAENANNSLIRAKRYLITGADQYFEGKELEFAKAIENGSFDKMSTMINEKQVNINHIGKQGVTFMIYAYRIKSKKGLRKVLELGGNINLISVRPSPNIKMLKKHDDADILNIQTYLLREMTNELEKDLEWFDIAMKAGADACLFINKGMHALYYAATFLKPAYKRMVELGANPNCKKDSTAYFIPLFSLASEDRWDLVYFSYQHGADLTDYFYRQISDGYDENGNFKYKRVKWQLDRDIQKGTEPNELWIKEYKALAYKKAIKDILRGKGFKFPELEEWEVKAGKTESYEKLVEKIE